MRSLITLLLLAAMQVNAALEYAYIDAALAQVDTHYRETYELNPVGVSFSFSKPVAGNWLLSGTMHALSDDNSRLGENTQTVFNSLKLGVGYYWSLSDNLHLTGGLAVAQVKVDFIKDEELAQHISEDQFWGDLGLRYQWSEKWEVDLGVQHKQISGSGEGFVRADVYYRLHPRFYMGVGAAGSEHTNMYSATGRIIF